MNYTLGDVCYWELYVNLEEFQAKHQYLQGTNISRAYFNLYIDTQNSNIQTYLFQGTSRRNATPVPAGRFYNLSLSKGETLVLVAYPTSATIVTPSSILQFTYNLSSHYYPPQGLLAQLKAELADDVDSSTYWLSTGVFGGLLFLAFTGASFVVCCCRDFDPMTDFERRRKRQAKKKLTDLKKAGGKKRKAEEKGMQPQESDLETVKEGGKK
jgi:hypothetical protein